MLLRKSQVNHRIQTQQLVERSKTQLARVGKSSKEQARLILAEIPDDVLLEAYEATKQVEANIFDTKPEHVVLMMYIEFELTERGLPIRSHLKLGWS